MIRDKNNSMYTMSDWTNHKGITKLCLEDGRDFRKMTKDRIDCIKDDVEELNKEKEELNKQIILLDNKINKKQGEIEGIEWQLESNEAFLEFVQDVQDNIRVNGIENTTIVIEET